MTGDSSRARSLEPRNLFGGISFALDPGRGFWSVVYALRLCCRCCLGVILAPLCAFETTAHGQLGAFVAIVTVFAQQLDWSRGRGAFDQVASLWVADGRDDHQRPLNWPTSLARINLAKVLRPGQQVCKRIALCGSSRGAEARWLSFAVSLLCIRRYKLLVRYHGSGTCVLDQVCIGDQIETYFSSVHVDLAVILFLNVSRVETEIFQSRLGSCVLTHELGIVERLIEVNVHVRSQVHQIVRIIALIIIIIVIVIVLVFIRVGISTFTMDNMLFIVLVVCLCLCLCFWLFNVIAIVACSSKSDATFSRKIVIASWPGELLVIWKRTGRAACRLTVSLAIHLLLKRLGGPSVWDCRVEAHFFAALGKIVIAKTRPVKRRHAQRLGWWRTARRFDRLERRRLLIEKARLESSSFAATAAAAAAFYDRLAQSRLGSKLSLSFSFTLSLLLLQPCSFGNSGSCLRVLGGFKLALHLCKHLLGWGVWMTLDQVWTKEINNTRRFFFDAHVICMSLHPA